MATTAPSPTIRVADPSSGEPLGELPVADERAVAAAVTAARQAQAGWAAVPATERAAALKRIAAAIRERGETLTRATARETGKLVGDARAAVEAAASTVEQFAELGPLHRGRSLQGAGEAIDITRHDPRGVVAAIVPWNDPIAIAAQGLAAALVTGNTVVLKPSERAPLCSTELHALFAAELPDGVATLVQGDARTGRPLVAHPDVDVVLHTGSAATGREIAVACAARGANAILELGGDDPLVVDAGVDPAWAAEQVARGAFANAGQICVAVERIYVHEAVAAPFLAELVRRARELRVGAALDEDAELGPLVDERALASVARSVDAALRDGARALCGGAPLDRPGCFYPATVLADVDDGMAVMRDETFGPVAPVAVVRSFDEAIARANRSRYGLAATVLTADDAHAHRAVRELRAGMVKVNAVFGGAPGGTSHPRGVSGTGLGHGPELLDELTLVTCVHLEPARRA